MTLDEAIRHCLEQARKLQDKADRVGDDESRQCMECAADHIQLAEWLRELKEAKRLLKAAVEDFVRIDEVKLLPENTIRPMLEYTNIIDIIRHKWRYADEAEKLIES